jgi:hypothetical protein
MGHKSWEAGFSRDVCPIPPANFLERESKVAHKKGPLLGNVDEGIQGIFRFDGHAEQKSFARLR